MKIICPLCQDTLEFRPNCQCKGLGFIEFNEEKLKELILYLCSKMEITVENLDTVLMLIDQEYYIEHGESMTGLSYIKTETGVQAVYVPFAETTYRSIRDI